MASSTTNAIKATIVLKYPLPKLDPTKYSGTLHVYGPADAKHLLLCCAGYPDNHTAFEPLAQRLATTKQYLVGVTCPAGYDDAIPLDAYPTEGFTFEEWSTGLQSAAKVLRGHATRPLQETTLTGVFHDWGVVPGGMYANTTLQEDLLQDIRPDRLVIYDVLVPFPKSTPNYIGNAPDNKSTVDHLKTVGYQWIWAVQFLLQRYTHPLIVLPYSIITSKITQWLGMLPLGPGDSDYFESEVINPKTAKMSEWQRLWYMGFPYYHFWKNILFGGPSRTKAFVKSFLLPANLEKTPVLYIYGAAKMYDLGDANAVAQLQQETEQGRPSRVVAVPNAGHWVYRQEETTCYEAMVDFLEKTTSTKKAE